MARSLLRLRLFCFMGFDTELLNEIKRLREQGKDVSNDDLILMQIMGLAANQKQMGLQIDRMNERIKGMEAGFRQQEQRHNEYPSMTWLIRHKPKETLVFAVGSFVLLSMWYVSGFRRPLMKMLGLPEF